MPTPPGTTVNVIIDSNPAQIQQILPSEPFHPAPVNDGTIVAQSKSMPPTPKFVFGRENEVEQILDSFIISQRPRVAIIGPGGLGKTTLALSVLHSPKTIEHYQQRYFVRCEIVTSLDLLLSELADVLQLSPAVRDAKLQDSILQRLNEPLTLICLDNFETPWLEVRPRTPIDEFLSHLDSLSNLAILVTMRGTERPSGIAWSTPLPSLLPLSRHATEQIFKNVSNGVVPTGNEYVKKLLRVVEGVPLAVTLISELLRDGVETPESLWKKWEQEYTKAIKTSDEHQLHSLDTSIHLSLSCRYMQECPDAAHLLRLLATLPDGFSDSPWMKDRLSEYIPSTFPFSEALQTLKRVALVYVDATSRIRLLPPVRHFCLSNLGPHADLNTCLTNFYVKLVTEYSNFVDPISHTLIPPELLNIESVLLVALDTHISESVLKACIDYTQWSMYVGIVSGKVISEAVKHMDGQQQGLGADSNQVSLYANMWQCLGTYQVHRNELDKAEQTLDHAAELHRQARSTLGEANTLQQLGKLQKRRGELGKAEKSLNRAIELHQQAQDVLGEANALQSLARLQECRNELEKAEQSLTRAVELHRQARSVLGEANDLQSLGELQKRRNELDKAEQSLTRAVELHRQVHDVLGEANDLQSLGELQNRRNELEKAEESLTCAVELHQQAQSILGKANALKQLGTLQVRHNKLDKAEQSLNRAIELHRQVQDILGEANDLQSLAELQKHRNELDKAEQSLTRAVELHRQAHSVLGEANGLHSLGELQKRHNELDKAEKSLTRAVELHQQARSVSGEANDLQSLAELQKRRNELDEAEKSLNRAIELHRQVQDVLGEANDLQSLGELQKHRNELDKAEESLTRAVELHRQAQDVLGEANDLQSLGELQKHRNELDKAEQSLTRAALLRDLKSS